MNQFDFIDISLTDILDILLVALLLFYLYKLVKGTVAINIFIGIVIIYFIWKITDLFKLDVLSNILGNFISVGFFALIVVFQQEIRKFLLLIRSSIGAIYGEDFLPDELRDYQGNIANAQEAHEAIRPTDPKKS